MRGCGAQVTGYRVRVAGCWVRVAEHGTGCELLGKGCGAGCASRVAGYG